MTTPLTIYHAKIMTALAVLRALGPRASALRYARKMLDEALGEANRARNVAARRSILRMRNWITHALNRAEAQHG